MVSYRFTSDAQEDLTKIRYYTVEQWGSNQSNKYLMELQRTISVLAESPMIGTKRADISQDTFSFPHASHVIYYLMREEYLLIFAVLHKNMVPNNHIFDRI